MPNMADKGRGKRKDEGRVWESLDDIRTYLLTLCMCDRRNVTEYGKAYVKKKFTKNATKRQKEGKGREKLISYFLILSIESNSGTQVEVWISRRKEMSVKYVLL